MQAVLCAAVIASRTIVPNKEEPSISARYKNLTQARRVIGPIKTFQITGNATLPNYLPRNTPAPLRTIHLHRATHAQAHATVSEQRRIRPGINAKIEVEVRTILVRSREPRLRAQRVALRRTQVGDHDDDAVARVADLTAGAVFLDCELPTCAAAGTGAGALLTDC